MTGGHAAGGRATGGCCDAKPNQKPRSHDTSRIAWAKLIARVGEFPLECPNCGGDIRLIAFITKPGPIRKILTHLGEPLEPPPIAAARGPPTDWGELVQAHHDRDVFQATDRRAARDRYSQPLTPAGREGSTKPLRGRTRRDSAPTAEKRHCKGSARHSWIRCFGTRKTGHSAHEPPISSESVTDVPLAGLSFASPQHALEHPPSRRGMHRGLRHAPPGGGAGRADTSAKSAPNRIGTGLLPRRCRWKTRRSEYSVTMARIRRRSPAGYARRLPLEP